jgi:hypothetical protein
MKRILILALALAAGSTHSRDSGSAGDTVPVAVRGIAPLTASVHVCYDFGCGIRDAVKLSRDDWHTVASWFNPPARDARDERERIRQAVGWMEVIVGRHTPTHLDKARNDLLPADSAGQMDCIDESMNTTTYLRLFESQGLLRWHRVLDRAYRKAILDQHWAGQVEELATGRRYVVDSWFADNGHLPFVQAAEEWEKIRYFGTSFDSTF